MNKSLKVGAVLAAGILALSACSSSEGEDSAPAGPSSSASSPVSSPASATPSPGPSVGARQYSPEELEAALAAVKAERGISGEVRNDGVLQPDLEGAAAQLAGVAVTPAKCKVLASTELVSAVSRANTAVLPLSGTDVLVVSSHEDPAELDAQMQDIRSALADCAEFQLEAGGFGLTATSSQIEASTEAETTLAHRILVSGFGDPVEILQVAAVSGSTNVQVMMTGTADGADPAADMAGAEDTVNAVLAELGK